jgi:hypothetical protein
LSSSSLDSIATVICDEDAAVDAAKAHLPFVPAMGMIDSIFNRYFHPLVQNGFMMALG